MVRETEVFVTSCKVSTPQARRADVEGDTDRTIVTVNLLWLIWP